MLDSANPLWKSPKSLAII